MEISEIVAKIGREECINAIVSDGSFSIRIDEYVQYVCTAIHNGHGVRKELLPKIQLSELERWNEEDPLTGNFCDLLPICITALDSRYEYDLNRDPDQCIYETPEQAWGKLVYNPPLTPTEKAKSLEKFKNFYVVLDALVSKLQKKFNACVVYEIHSYNLNRQRPDAPVFNLGTKMVDVQKYRTVIDRWLEELSKIQLPDIQVEAAENDVFFGRSFHVNHLSSAFKNTLVLPTEIKKVYCNEETGKYYNSIINAMKYGLSESIRNHAFFFSRIF